MDDKQQPVPIPLGSGEFQTQVNETTPISPENNTSTSSASPTTGAEQEKPISNNSDSPTDKTIETKPSENDEKMYEFTSNLNIAPINENEINSVPTKTTLPPEIKPQTPLQEAVGKIDISPKETIETLKKQNAQKTAPVQTGPIVFDEKGNAISAVGSPSGEKALRTYESDIAEALARKNVSVADITIAEKEKRERERKEKEERERLAKEQETQASLQASSYRETESQIPKQIPIEERLNLTSSIVEPQQQEQGTINENIPQQNIGTNIPNKLHSSSKKLFILLTSMIFILGGIVASYFLYIASPVSQTEPVQVTNTYTKPIINTESSVKINIDGLQKQAIANKIKNELNKSLPANSVKEIVFTKISNNQEMRVTAPEMIKVMDIPVPDIIKRTLLSTWMMGIYTDKNGNKDLFIIANQNFFQNAFTGMLSWEKVMIDDLKQYLPLTQITANVNEKSTGSETDEIIMGQIDNIEQNTNTQNSNATKTANISGYWTDGIIKNKDVREYVIEDGPVLLLYSLIDSKRIIVATKESTLSEIISRIEQQSYMR